MKNLLLLIPFLLIGCNVSDSDSPEEVTYYVNEMNDENAITETPTLKTITYTDESGEDVSIESSGGVFTQTIPATAENLRLRVDGESGISVRLFIYVDGKQAESFRGTLNGNSTIEHSL